ncbi:MAG: GNAT family N-acetyltransferase [Cyanobacteria bacterium J06649_4]
MTTQKPQAIWSFVPFSRELDRQSFDCGKSALNKYLQISANQHQKSDISRITVAVPAQDTKVIAGYYTLNASRLNVESLSAGYRKKLPQHLEIPSIKIGQMAVDQRYSGQGLGKKLLMNALYSCYVISGQLAVHSVTVDAYDDDAKNFWLHYSFIPFADRSESLFLPMKTIRALFDN